MTRRAETLSPSPDAAPDASAPPAWSDLRTRPRASADRPLAWAMVMAPVLVAVVAAVLMVHVTRMSGSLFERNAGADRLRASGVHLRQHIDRIVSGGAIETESLGDEVHCFDSTLNALTRDWDDGRGLSSDSQDALDAELRGLRLAWARQSQALLTLASGNATEADADAARAVVRAGGAEFALDAGRLAQDVERHVSGEQREHERLIGILLIVLIASLVVGAVVKHVDMRRLRRSQIELERLSIVAESTGSNVVIADAHGRGLWANDAFLRTTGWEDVARRTLWELVGAEPGSFSYDVLQRATFRRESHTGEYEFRRRDGQPFWASIELMPVRHDDDPGTDVLLMFTDITARMQASRDLFASEARFRSALAALSEGFLLVDGERGVMQCNAAALRILGIRDEKQLTSVESGGALRFVREDGSPLPDHESPTARTLRTGRASHGMVVGVDRPAGGRVWLSVDAVPFVLPGEGGHGVVTTFVDITARRQAEQALRVLTRVVEESPTMVLITDRARKIEYVNPVFERTTGYTLAEIRGRTPDVMLSDRTPQSTWDALHDALAHGLPWRGEIHNVTHDGTPWLADSQSFALHDLNGEATHHVALLRDITETRRREAELVRAREDALAAARAKSEFLQNVSHELRTPLNGIMGMAELLLQTPLEPGQRGDLLQLRRSAEELLEVVTHLFEFANNEANEAQADAIPFRLRDVLGDVETALASEAEQRGLRWSVDVAPDVPDAVRGAPARLRRVLLSLANNAVKFTEHGEVELTVRRLGGGDDPVGVRFAIRDTGIGIPPERQAVIFDAFSQVDGSTTRRYGGIGLGLALASRLVQQMGGRLDVTSEPGVGSTFGLTLPLARAAESEIATPNAARMLLDGSRVLVVTSHLPGRAAMRASLERAGADVRVLAAGDDTAGELARAAREGRPYRAAVIDSRDGGFDGFAAFARLGTAGAARPPVLLFSAGHLLDEAERCRALGIAGYLGPPARETDLVDALRFLGPVPAGAAAPALVTRESLREARARRRVLLVDDNAVNRRVASRLLERSGYEVGVAVDGRDALEQFTASTWDAVLMDVQMPEMDGIEATRRIRELEAERGQARTPVLALTAHTLDADRLAVLEAGMDDLVPKPILPDDLMTALQRHLPATPVATDAAGPPAALADVIDWNEAVTRLEGDEELYAQLLHIYEADAEDMRRNLDAACASGDPVRLERCAHALKGASATISARHVRDLAEQVERLARERRMDEALAHVGELGREMKRLVSALGALREREAA